MKTCISVLILLFAIGSSKAQPIYFPPTVGTTWDTVSPVSMGWCTQYVDTLYNYLDNQDTKGFMLLKDGKIVLEKYFNNHTRDSFWYWASAGKSLTAFLVGKAQEEGKLKISDTTSSYLGSGWTSLTIQQEEKITIRHQLTMTTGLDDNVPDIDCTIDSCLKYLNEPGIRWAYHNAPYTLLEDVVSAATSTDYNIYTNQKVKSITGMNGFWLRTGSFNNLYYSNMRSMARFGLLMQNKGKWANTSVLSDSAYLSQMTNTSQNINLSYGYLWWLNGKSSFMIPQLQTVFPGSWAPSAPPDMYAALGKNGQVLCIAPSKGLVMVRMGNQPSGNAGLVPTIFVEDIWKILNSLMCNSTSIQESDDWKNSITIFPNPASQLVNIHGAKSCTYKLIDVAGKNIMQSVLLSDNETIPLHMLEPGMYFILIENKMGDSMVQKFLVK
jgi:CubicO group peptidase (beta-lactamase class C family)